MVVSELKSSMLSTIFLISILSVGFNLVLCDKGIPVIYNDLPVDECIHFKNCSTGSKLNGLDLPTILQTCLQYEKKLTPAQGNLLRGIDKKTTRREGISFFYLCSLISIENTFYNVTKWFQIAILLYTVHAP